MTNDSTLKTHDYIHNVNTVLSQYSVLSTQSTVGTSKKVGDTTRDKGFKSSVECSMFKGNYVCDNVSASSKASCYIGVVFFCFFDDLCVSQCLFA